MKSKNIIALGALIFGLGLGHVEAKNLNVDTSASKVVWLGTKVVGSHTGELTLKSGKLKVEKGNLVGGTLVVDMTTMTTTDLNGELAQKLIGHLKSDDFFSVDKHKESTFKIAKVQMDKNGQATLKGQLTIKGISQPAEFKGKISMKGDSLSGQGKLEFDRTKFNVRYGSGSFFQNLGDKAIDDKVVLTINIKAKG